MGSVSWSEDFGSCIKDSRYLMNDINLDTKENIFELLNFLTRYN